MKNFNLYIKSIITILLFSFVSCEENEDVVVPNQYIINDDVNLSYTNLTTYSYLQDIVSDAPSFKIDTDVYNFSIISVKTSNGNNAPNIGNYSIDSKSGIITVNNNNGILKPGETYSVNVGINNVNGIIANENAYSITVNDIPLDYSITNSTATVGFLDEGEIATISYLDTSGSNIIDASSVRYSLTNSPNGFTINNTTGVISRNTSASTGTHVLNVTIKTNVGSLLFDGVLTVTVGASPTIVYNQLSGVTKLSSVTLSPWTAYTTATPSLNGMDANGGYAAILPATLPTDAITANADGSLSIAADQNLPIGTYSIGVNVTNGAGVTVPFEDLFTVVVETRWETTPYFEDTFNDTNTGFVDPGNTLYPDYAGYTLGDTNKWQKAVVTKSGSPDVRGIRLFNPGVTDNYLVKSVDITGVKAMRITFGEVFGYNNNFVSTYKRGVYAGESTTDLEAGNFNAASWTAVMPVGDTRFPGDTNWPTRIPNVVSNIDVDLSNISGNNLKLAWYLGSNGTAQNGQYFIESISAEVSIAFSAEEN